MEHPDPHKYPFDLEITLTGVVSVSAHISEDALTAPVLGTERTGHGVAIGDGRLVVTIGYIITEADSVWITQADGKVVPSFVLGYDQETGYGLIQTAEPLEVRPIDLGTATLLKPSDPVIVAGCGGIDQAIQAKVLAKREFAGYWEYVLDEAVFTAPAHPNWGGAALIGPDGRLAGIGSLLVQQVSSGGSGGANMMVPIDILCPILDDLRKYGRQNKPPRPWIGFLVQELNEELVISGVYSDCPADRAGLKVGDVILEVNLNPTLDLADLFRRIWKLGAAGVEVPMTVVRDGERKSVVVHSIDRHTSLRWSSAVH